MTGLAEASEFISSTAETAGPAVVGIGPGWRGGSGVVVAEGRVLTAAHNLRRDNPSVVFADGRRERAEVLGVDRDVDLAILGVDTGAIEPIRPASEADAGGSRGIGAVVVGLA